MYKDGVLTISDWQKGIGQSPYVGFGTMQNVDVTHRPGVAVVGNKNTSQYTQAGLPIAGVFDSVGNLWTGTNSSNGELYRNGTLYTTGVTIPIKDIKVFSDVLFITRGTSGASYIDVLGYLSGGPLNYTAAKWTSLQHGFSGFMLPAVDGALYIANGNYVAKITGVTTSPTVVDATLTAQALDLPSDEQITTMAELGNYIAIAVRPKSYPYSEKPAKIYLWDRVSSSFKIPTSTSEKSIDAMINVNNRLIYVCGETGNVYESDSVSYRLFFNIPNNRRDTSTFTVYPNAINYYDNELMIGTSNGNDSFPSTYIHGVWKYRQGAITFSPISTGNYGTNQQLSIGFIALSNLGSQYIGWGDGTTYGLDLTKTGSLSTVGDAYIESPIITVGDPLNKKNFDNIYIYLGKNLKSGDQIKVSYRKSPSDTYTTIKTFTFTESGARNNLFCTANISEAVMVQFKLEFAQSGTTTPIEVIRMQLI